MVTLACVLQTSAIFADGDIDTLKKLVAIQQSQISNQADQIAKQQQISKQSAQIKVLQRFSSIKDTDLVLRTI